MTRKLFIKTYGCQMNVYDSQKIVHLLKPLGFEETKNQDEGDLIVLNTCHIRGKAEHKVFSDLGRIKNKEKIIVVAGCVAQAEGEEILNQAPFVNIVVGPQTYHRLPEMVTKALRSKDQIVDTDFPVESKFDVISQPYTTTVSALLTVQEGCDKFCTFCCVPYTRGPEYSRPVDDIIREATRLVELGAKEIILLGQNVNAYHGLSKIGKIVGLGDLIRECAKIPGLKRIRYTTSHPKDMDENLMKAHGEVEQLMPFLHLPVQSGSDKILSQMNRKHTRDSYYQIIDSVRKHCPDIALSSDFIVGFPGETDQDFKDTLDLINDIGFAQAYSFKYSPRHGTPAALMDNPVTQSIQDDRLAVLQDSIQHQQRAFNQNFIGKTIDVLFDRVGHQNGQLMGKSTFMQSVYIQASPSLLGKTVPIKVQGATAHSLTGLVSG